MPVQPSRRDVLRAAALGAAATALAGCTSASVPEGPPPAPTPDEKARAVAAQGEQALAERATATAKRHPTLTVARQAALAHSAHADALSETLAPGPVRPSAAPSAGGSGAAGPAVPTNRNDAAKALATAESTVADAHRASLTTPGVTGDLARLLASVAASDGAFADAVRVQGEA